MGALAEKLKNWLGQLKMMLTGAPSPGEDEYDIRLRKHRRRIYIRTALICAAGVLLFFLIRYMVIHHTYSSYEVIESEEQMDTISTYSYVNGNVLRYSSDGASLLKKDMQEIWSYAFNMTQPVVDVCGDTILIYDKRGTLIHICDSKGAIGSFNANMPILSARVSKNGTVAAILDLQDESEIQYYNAQGQVIAAVNVSARETGSPTALDISDDGKYMAVSYVTVSGGAVGSKLVFYDFRDSTSDEHVLATHELAGTIVPELRYYGGNSLMAVRDNGFTVYRGEQEPKAVKTVDFADEIESCFHDDKYIGFIFSSDDPEHRYRMEIYSSGGAFVSKSYVDIIYEKIHMYNNEILLVNGSEAAVYSKRGVRRFAGSLNEGIIYDMLKLGRNKYFVITDMQALMIRFE